jgi:hypothetical protein
MTVQTDQQKVKTALEAGQVTCFISKQKVPAIDTVEVEYNGRRVLVHKRFVPVEPQDVKA